MSKNKTLKYDQGIDWIKNKQKTENQREVFKMTETQQKNGQFSLFDS